MNLEAIDWYRQSKYLNEKLGNSRIQRIYMPTPTSLLLQCRGTSTLNLLCDLGNNGPAVYLPEKAPETPDTPPAFCMLLRKHLEDGHIVRIEQKNFDRVLSVLINAPVPGDKTVEKELIFELSGRNNNILCLQDGKIINCLKHIHPGMNRVRTLLPDEDYVAPPQSSKLHPLAIASGTLVSAINNNPAETLTKKIMGTIMGIGTKTAEFLAQAEDLAAALDELKAKCNALPNDEVNREIIVKMAAKPLQLDLQKKLTEIVKSTLTHLTKKHQALTKDLATAEDADQYRIQGDNIMAYLPQIKKGQTSATVANIYDGENLTLNLNPALTGAENAQAAYKRYNKYQRALKELAQQIEGVKNELDYLTSIETALALPLGRPELEEIQQELMNAGVIRKTKNKTIHTPPSQPIKIKLADATIYVGKNNRQNDLITFKIATPNDLWFHVKDIPGSHVVLSGEHSEENIKIAMNLAAYYSKARNGSNIPVDMVTKKFVKKPSGAKPGFVIFTNNRTSYINIDTELLKPYLH